MGMTIDQAIEMIMRGETPEQYKNRLARIRRLANERDELVDAIEVLGDDPRSVKKQERLDKVLKMLDELK